MTLIPLKPLLVSMQDYFTPSSFVSSLLILGLECPPSPPPFRHSHSFGSPECTRSSHKEPDTSQTVRSHTLISTHHPACCSRSTGSCFSCVFSRGSSTCAEREYGRSTI